MEQSLIDAKLKEFKIFVDNAVLENRPIYEGTAEGINYIMSKVEEFGEKYKLFMEIVN